LPITHVRHPRARFAALALSARFDRYSIGLEVLDPLRGIRALTALGDRSSIGPGWSMSQHGQLERANHDGGSHLSERALGTSIAAQPSASNA
jgi:hypothetical protein